LRICWFFERFFGYLRFSGIFGFVEDITKSSRNFWIIENFRISGFFFGILEFLEFLRNF
jgi:hypothetical protein